MNLEFTAEYVVPFKTPASIYQEHLNRYLFASRLIREKTVLDVACATGYGSNILKDKANFVIGVDVQKKVILYAKEHYGQPNVYFLVADATKLPFRNGVFDVIVSFETVEHLRNHFAFSYECARMIKKSGDIHLFYS